MSPTILSCLGTGSRADEEEMRRKMWILALILDPHFCVMSAGQRNCVVGRVQVATMNVLPANPANPNRRGAVEEWMR